MLELALVIILIAVVSVPVLMNSLGVFHTWKTHTLPAIVKFEAVDNHEFLKGRDELFKEYDKAMVNVGFCNIGSSMLNDSHIIAYFRLYWHEDRKVAATLVAIEGQIEKLTYLEITQQYIDGSVLDVSNSTRVEAYPDVDFKLSYHYPRISDVEKLLEAHSKLRAKYKSTAKVIDYDVSTGFKGIEEFIKKESDALVSRGIVKEKIDSEGRRSLTLYGAAVLTYRSIFPGKNIWTYLKEKRSEMALRDT